MKNMSETEKWIRIIFGFIFAMIALLLNIIWKLTIPAIIIMSICKIIIATYPFGWLFTIFVPIIIGIPSLFICLFFTYIGKAILEE